MKTGREVQIRKFLFPVILSLGILMLVSLACGPNLIPQTLDEMNPTKAPTATKVAQAVDESSTTNQASAVTSNFSEGRNYYGPDCPDGEEENAPYRWAVELLIDPVNRLYEGIIKFHNCPGGGRAVYRVSGTSSDGNQLSLAGQLVNGGGDLFESSPKVENFTFDISTKNLAPNLAP